MGMISRFRKTTFKLNYFAITKKATFILNNVGRLITAFGCMLV